MGHFLIGFLVLAAAGLTLYTRWRKDESRKKKKVELQQKTYMEYIADREEIFRRAAQSTQDLTDKLNLILSLYENEKRKKAEQEALEKRKRQNGHFRNGRTS